MCKKLFSLWRAPGYKRNIPTDCTFTVLLTLMKANRGKGPKKPFMQMEAWLTAAGWCQLAVKNSALACLLEGQPLAMTKPVLSELSQAGLELNHKRFDRLCARAQQA